jgi:CheY-like chemotaxis protein
VPPVIVYTGRPLTKSERDSLRSYTEAVVMKDGPAASPVVDELRAFARRLKGGPLPKTTEPKLEGGDLPTCWQGKKILVADDDMRAAYALSALLRARGAEPLVADTGRAALDALGENPDIEAVLIDIIMPEMDGYEAMRRIRLMPGFRDLPIIALTAKQMKVDEQQCLEAGATAYITKPVEPALLFAVLQSNLPNERPQTLERGAP